MGEIWGLGYLIAAYAIAWAVLAGYAVYVGRRVRRAERELAAMEAPANEVSGSAPQPAPPPDHTGDREVVA